jgi:hypothetical protein
MRAGKGFTLAVWVGILLNWTFVVYALSNPRHLIRAMDLGDDTSTVWLFNYSVLLALLSCFYIPAARNPVRYRVNAWLLIVARFIPASTFFVGVSTGFLARGFTKLGSVDSVIGAIELIFLLVLERQSHPPQIAATRVV